MLHFLTMPGYHNCTNQKVQVLLGTYGGVKIALYSSLVKVKAPAGEHPKGALRAAVR